MYCFMRLAVFLAALLGLVGCGASAPATTAPQPAPTAPASTQLALAPASSTPTTAPPTAAPATPSPTAVPPTVAPEVRGWSEIAATNAGPQARYDHSTVLDPVRQQLVIFGGRDAETFGDTWIIDLATRTWREVPVAGPAPRFGHGAVYDATHRQMLIVMGQGADFFNDVWAFDLDQETWTELKANDRGGEGPRPRYGQSAALDAQGRVLISHGFSDQGRFDDTWAFDLAQTRWVNLTPPSAPKPLKRCLHTLIYDATTDRLLLFGGCSSGFGPCPQGDLWAFDVKTTTWTELIPSGAAPSARSNASLVYQPATQTLYLFGGKTEDGASAETWSYDLGNNRWSHLEAQNGPSARSSQATGQDGQAKRAFIFGGLTAAGSSADLWEWSL